MEKPEMIEMLVSHYCSGSKAQFAKMLGVRPQTINTWITRSTFDAELLYSKCEGVSGDWLLSGDGEMLKGESSPTPIVDLKIIASQQETIARLASVIERLTAQKGGRDALIA